MFKKSKAILLTAIALFFFTVVFITFYYTISLMPVSKKDKKDYTFEIKKGEILSTVLTNLEKENLIRNDFTLKIYSKFQKGTPQAGTYVLKKNMSAKEIYKKIISGKATYDTVWITFVEGKRLTYIADEISKSFPYSKEEVLEVLDDKSYIGELINKYDFLTKDILKENIYHPLEGYLFPDTYEFLKSSSIKEIIEVMLDNTKSKISDYTDLFKTSNFSIHEIFTMSSIVELEGARSKDRNGIAGVFYNRLARNITLGSDVTTYYAVNKDFSVDLTVSDLNSCNGFNTRGACVKGLPAGPIASFSINSLDASLNPEVHDYLFFVADKNGQTYFTSTSDEHDKIIKDLKNSGLWFEY